MLSNHGGDYLGRGKGVDLDVDEGCPEVRVELGITVFLLREYLVVGRCDVLEGNGVKKGVLDGCFDSGVSIFVLCVCVELG